MLARPPLRKMTSTAASTRRSGFESAKRLRNADSTVSMRIRVRRKISRNGLKIWVNSTLAAAADGSIGTNSR